MRSLGKTLLAFALLHSILQGQICLLLEDRTVQIGLNVKILKGFQGGASGKELAHQYRSIALPASAGDMGLLAGLGRSLEEGSAIHSRFLAWRIPWAKESGGLQSIGLHRV